MGNRCYLYVNESYSGFYRQVSETNNRFAIEWLAWVPEHAVNEHLAYLENHRQWFEHDVDEANIPEAARQARTINVSYQEAISAFKDSLASTLLQNPQLAPALLELKQLIDECALVMTQPLLRFDFLEMINFYGLDDYISDLKKLHGFWFGRTPWKEVVDATEIGSRPQMQSVFSAEIEQELKSLCQQAELLEVSMNKYSATQPHWREKYEDLIGWIISLSMSAVLFPVYYISNSWWFAGLASSAVMGILLAWFIRKPKIHPKPEAENSLRLIKQEIKELKQRHSALISTTNRPFPLSLPEISLLEAHPAITHKNPVEWSEYGIKGRCLNGKSIEFTWQQISKICYALDCSLSGNNTVLEIVTVQVAQNSSSLATSDITFKLCFNQNISPGLLLLNLHLLWITYA